MNAYGALIDTGPLVAFLNRRDRHHAWACTVFGEVRGPYLTTEANLAEACHLLEREAVKGALQLFKLLDSGLIQSEAVSDVLSLVQAKVALFKDRRVDFADACLLVLAERHGRLPLITTDRADFVVYFRGRQRRLVMPPA